MKKDWKAGIEVPSLARREESVFVEVIQMARTGAVLVVLWWQYIIWWVGKRTLSEQHGQPELLGPEVLKPATLALRIILENLIASSYGVERCASTLVLRARGDLRAFGVNVLCHNRASVNILALAKEALGGVSLLLSHFSSFALLSAECAGRKIKCGEWSFSNTT